MQEKKYRLNVAAVVLAPSYPFDCRILLAQRSDIKGAWQFPQGGIDENESPKDALFRELKEEIGTNKVEIIAEFNEWLTYDFPQNVAQKKLPYAGQKQKYFLVRLFPDAKINLNTKSPEFDDCKFVSVTELFDLVTHFKKDIYVKVIEYFKEKGYI